MKLLQPLLVILSLSFMFSCGGNQQGANSQSEDTAEANMEPAQWLVYEGKSSMPQLVLVSGDEEYRSEEALPMLARILSKHHGFNCVVLFAQDPGNPGIVDPNFTDNIPGVAALDTADMAIFFTRFRALPDAQMEHVEKFLMAGKPLIGIRTSTHAFHFKDSTSNYFHYGNYFSSEDAWNGGFGRVVLGENWVAHHGHHGEQSTRGVFAEDQDNHPVLTGVTADGLWGPTDVYEVRLPMQNEVTPIVYGKTIDRTEPRDDNDPLLGMRSSDDGVPAPRDKDGKMFDPNDPMMPIVWTKNYQLPEGKPGVSLTSTLGASVDLLSPDLRRLFVNGVYWLNDMPVPETANVELVNDYNPSKFAFQSDEYWDDQNLLISELK